MKDNVRVSSYMKDMPRLKLRDKRHFVWMTNICIILRVLLTVRSDVNSRGGWRSDCDVETCVWQVVAGDISHDTSCVSPSLFISLLLFSPGNCRNRL